MAATHRPSFAETMRQGWLPAERRAAKGGRTNGAGPPAAGRGVGSSDIRASRSWQAPPAMNSSCWRRNRWKGMSVAGPSTTYSSSARIMRRRADSRSTSQTISLAIIGS